MSAKEWSKVDDYLVSALQPADPALEQALADSDAAGLPQIAVAPNQGKLLMLLAQLEKALGSLDRVERIVKLGVFVNSVGGFTDQPKVADGASQLMVDIFGDAGRHARSAVGVPVLPLGAVVEVDAVVQVRD